MAFFGNLRSLASKLASCFGYPTQVCMEFHPRQKSKLITTSSFADSPCVKIIFDMLSWMLMDKVERWTVTFESWCPKFQRLWYKVQSWRVKYDVDVCQVNCWMLWSTLIFGGDGTPHPQRYSYMCCPSPSCNAFSVVRCCVTRPVVPCRPLIRDLTKKGLVLGENASAT